MNEAASYTYKTYFGEDSQEYLNAQNNLTVIYQGLGRYRDAINTFNSIIFQLEKREVLSNYYSTMLNNIAEVCRTMEDYNNAEAYYLKSIVIQKIKPL